jgi:hypothetical protein
MKTSIPLIALAGGLIGLTAMQVNARKQLRDAQALAAQQAETINALRAAADQPTNPPVDLEQLRADARDVLRLRAEVARLERNLSDTRAQVQVQIPKPITVTSNQAPDPSQINFKVKFISVPAGSTSLEGTAVAEQQVRALMESLRKTEGVRFVTQGDVTMLSGRQAELQLSLGEEANSPRINVGLISENRPGSLDIGLELILTSDAVVDLLPDDPRPEGLPQLSQVRSTQSSTNTLNLFDGHTAILHRSISREEKWLAADPNVGITEQRELLILLTPTLITPTGNRLHPETQETAQIAN